MNARMRFIGAEVWKLEERWLTLRWVRQMAAAHGVPCSCPLCGNRRRHHGPKISEQRRRPSDD